MSASFHGNQLEESKRLLNHILECVKQCQKRFGGKTELATEFDPCVSSLCAALEDVFLQGLRSKPLENVSALKHVSGIVTKHLINDNPSFWPFVNRHLTKHEQERYNSLKHIWTNTGRGKAWIRSTLNERSLERYINTLISNREILRTYYEDWALLCDVEKTSLLPDMAAGLASILFAVSIDKPEFNSQTFNRVEKEKPEPIIEAPLIGLNKSRKELKKRHKVAKQIISFDEDTDSVLSSSIASSNGSVTSERNSEVPLHASKNSNNIHFEMEEETTSNSSTDSSGDNSEKIVDSKVERKLSLHSTTSRTSYNLSLDGSLTPLDPYIGELLPVSVEICETKNIENDVEVPSDVSAVLTVVEEKNKEETFRLNEKINLLTKENDNLKDQVKKYMEAVQMLNRDENSLERSLTGLELNVPDYKSEAKLYEQKLVQVAEMHAELMDFNVVLQKSLLQKENLLEKYKQELENLRGPVSLDELSEDSRTCVHIWIPSAFLTGTGSDAYHVYQIFLRAGTDEWNIYRRYAQFHALHSDLKKLDPRITRYDFPPKRGLRNKDSSLVEDRRKRLQLYLRKIIAHWPELSQCNSRFILEQHLSFFKEQKEVKKDKRGIFSSRRSAGNTSSEGHYTGL